MSVLLTLKALHILGFVFWFAGLYSLAGLLVSEKKGGEGSIAGASPVDDFLHQKQKRVYQQIANPGMMLTWTAGIIMLVINPAYLSVEYGTPGWMHLKLTLLVLFLGYHLYLKRVMKEVQKGTNTFSVFQMTFFAQIPLFFMAAIIFLAVLGKAGILNYGSWAGGVLLLVLIGYGLSRR
jgi:putative membrane protein